MNLSRKPKINKYGAKKTEIDGVVFSSKREAKRYADLKTLMRAGEILCLTLQPSYDIVINSIKICTVKLDFEYLTKAGKKITEDSKGFDNPLSKLKRKLVKAQHGIDVVIV